MSKKIFKTGALSFSGSSYVVTAFNYAENYGEIDVTDTGTSGDGKEYLGSRAERTFTVSLFMEVTGSDLTMNSSAPLEMDFEGKTYAGTGSMLTKTVDASIDNAVEVTYTGRFNGSVTVTPEA